MAKKIYSKAEKRSFINGLNLGKKRGAEMERCKNKVHFNLQRTYTDDYFNSLSSKVTNFKS